MSHKSVIPLAGCIAIILTISGFGQTTVNADPVRSHIHEDLHPKTAEKTIELSDQPKRVVLTTRNDYMKKEVSQFKSFRFQYAILWTALVVGVILFV